MNNETNVSKNTEFINVMNRRIAAIKHMYPNIEEVVIYHTRFDYVPKSIKDELFSLWSLIGLVEQGRNLESYIGSLEDGITIYPDDVKKYRELNGEVTQLAKQNEKYISQEDMESFQDPETDDIEKSTEVKKKVGKNTQLILEIKRRRFAIEKMYPNIEEAPKSISEEYNLEGELLDHLYYSIDRLEEWGIEGSKTFDDGITIIAFRVDLYEEILGKVNTLKKENEGYITPEYMKSFQYPEIDFEELKRRAKGIQDLNDYEQLENEISESIMEFEWHDVMVSELRRISRGAFYRARELGIFPAKKEEVLNDNDSTHADVGEGIFKRIYFRARQARVGLKHALSKLAEIFNRKSKGKTEETNDINKDRT